MQLLAFHDGLLRQAPVLPSTPVISAGTSQVNPLNLGSSGQISSLQDSISFPSEHTLFNMVFAESYNVFIQSSFSLLVHSYIGMLSNRHGVFLFFPAC